MIIRLANVPVRSFVSSHSLQHLRCLHRIRVIPVAANEDEESLPDRQDAEVETDTHFIQRAPSKTSLMMLIVIISLFAKSFQSSIDSF